MAVYRIYTTKKPKFSIKYKHLLEDIKLSLKIDSLEDIKLYIKYDVEGIDKETFNYCVDTVFSEPQIDDVFYELPEHNYKLFAFEYLPGQFDQRADSASQCIQFITRKNRPIIKTANIVYLFGNISNDNFIKIKKYFINPVESRETSLENCISLENSEVIVKDIYYIEDFINFDDNDLENLIKKLSLSMDIDDIKICQSYFISEKRNPSITEIRLLDTYWSDHCRHTTFMTILDNIDINDENIRLSYEKYLNIRKELYVNKQKDITLMDIATIGAKYLKKLGYLNDLDLSDEINACSVKIDVNVDSKVEKWLLMFKNETHNHPTEIEPFGGAATCLGGAIRDPLSGRSYVYQAMRITGAADPLQPVEDTIHGKLPQNKICITSAQGYSSYGNQIGLATGFVKEIYHPDYVAKRMEVGAVIGAAPIENVIRKSPEKGDVVVLIGGRTGRDGCGGATGSSKSHDINSLETCGAEVQKGNPPEERKIQRFFRNKNVSTMIKKCNDFGAGGVSVAVGELADSINIYLDKLPKKYYGLDATEIAISESQERMAVVISSNDVDKFISMANEENLEATIIADITDNNRLIMNYNGKEVVNLSRDFINLNGAKKRIDIFVDNQNFDNEYEMIDNSIVKTWIKFIKDLNICSQKGLVDRFDSTIGSNTVLMPLGGKNKLTEIQAMVAKIPVLFKETDTCSLMSASYDPYLSKQSPYYGAYYCVIDSVAKIIATGGNYKKCWLSFQEYFERLGKSKEKWGKPFISLLGALEAQLQLNIASIGGKDSMSGTFEQINVPPTLISFAVSLSNTSNIISPEFKNIGSKVYFINVKKIDNGLLDQNSLLEVFDRVNKLISEGIIISAYALSFGGIAGAITKMSLGNYIGFTFDEKFNKNTLFNKFYGSFIVETNTEIDIGTYIGSTNDSKDIKIFDECIDLIDLQSQWESTLESIYPTKTNTKFEDNIEKISFERKEILISKNKIVRPKVLIPVFPGTNCEYDTATAFEKYGAKTDIFVVRNLTINDIEESILLFKEKILNSQIIAIPGGFSGGDEPDGSGKFITAFFRNDLIKNAIDIFLYKNDGLMCGICNGFQALIKLGLVPYGKILLPNKNSPTLTFNTILRHQSNIINTRVASNKSPWFMYHNVGDINSIAISHGEGRFIADISTLNNLIKNGQIATQYVDDSGNPSMDIKFNPNQSTMAIEGITSVDGRILGKMGHSERTGKDLYKNIIGNKEQLIFKGAVDYFKL